MTPGTVSNDGHDTPTASTPNPVPCPECGFVRDWDTNRHWITTCPMCQSTFVGVVFTEEPMFDEGVDR